VITASISTVVLIVLSVMNWSDGEQVAGIASTVGTLLAAGCAVVPLLSRNQHEGGVRLRRWQVSRTGDVKAGARSIATTGVLATSSVLPDSLKVSRTGTAAVGDDGHTNTGIAEGALLRPRPASTTNTLQRVSVPTGDEPVKVSHTGSARAGDHSTVNSGLITVGQLVVPPTDMPRPYHTRYLARVQQLRAADGLLDRERELAELADFCAKPEGPSYTWWRAGPWAGKTALMAHFVVHPPAGVRIVPFFVLARDASEADGDAFLEVTIPQLADLAEASVPTAIAGDRRLNLFQELVEQADDECSRRGERLILLVDGLDEDQGLTPERATRSIASMLPIPNGRRFRVVVAGRLNPDVPYDVAADHPLRRAATSRTLVESPHAEVAKDQAHAQLRAHLHDDGLAHAVLALVTVARGGLTVTDLAELTDTTEADVRDALLSDHRGRAYQLRGQAQTTSRREVMLAHDELRTAAEKGLSAREKSHWLSALLQWASGYRASSWTKVTPEYLLTGLDKVLLRSDLTAELVQHVADIDRLDRLRAVTGGDATGLAQVRAALENVAGDPAHLSFSVRLALVRDHLSDRNGNLPPAVLETWVRLGEPKRAIALAESSDHAPTRARALAGLLGYLAEGNHGAHAGRVAESARAAAIIADRVTPTRESRLKVAEQLAQFGFVADATDLLRNRLRHDGEDSMSEAVVAADLLDLIARSGNAAASAGTCLADLLSTLREPVMRHGAIADVVAARARRRDPRDSKELVATAIQELDAFTDPLDRIYSWQSLARAAADAGDWYEASGLLDLAAAEARALPDEWTRIDNLDDIVRTTVAQHRHDTTRSLALETRNLADQLSPRRVADQQRAYGWLSHHLAQAGDFTEALATANRIDRSDDRTSTLVGIALSIAGQSQTRHALAVLDELPPDTEVSRVRVALATHAAAAGRFRQADAMLAVVNDTGQLARGLATTALYAARRGDEHLARTLAVRAEETAQGTVSSSTASTVLRGLGAAHLAQGESHAAAPALKSSLEYTRRTADSVGDLRYFELADAANSLCRLTDPEHAAELVQEVLDGLGRSLRSDTTGSFVFILALSLIRLAEVSPYARDRSPEILEEALRIQRSNLSVLADLIEDAAELLGPESATAHLLDIEARAQRMQSGEDLAETLAAIAGAWKAIGDAGRADQYFTASLSTAASCHPRKRRAILMRVLRPTALPSVEIVRQIAETIDSTDLETVGPNLVNALAQIGTSEETQTFLNRPDIDPHRRFTVSYLHGLLESGRIDDALAKLDSIADEDTAEEIVPALANHYLNSGDISTAFLTISSAPWRDRLSDALTDTCRRCAEETAPVTLSYALRHLPLQRVAEILAEKTPTALTANADLVARLYPAPS
jgi:tetratricopeptide (TPR) repeat protein